MADCIAVNHGVMDKSTGDTPVRHIAVRILRTPYRGLSGRMSETMLDVVKISSITYPKEVNLTQFRVGDYDRRIAP